MAAANDLPEGPQGSCPAGRLTVTEADVQTRSRGGVGAGAGTKYLGAFPRGRANWSVRLYTYSFIHSQWLICTNYVPDTEYTVAEDVSPLPGVHPF